jgi:hypothetical protein
MRYAVLSLAAAVAALLALGAPAKSLAGDERNPAYGSYEASYGADRWDDGDWYDGDGGWSADVRRDGNVLYNAYNSYDGYARHRYGDYWVRPGDYDGDDYGYQGGYDGAYYGDQGYAQSRGRKVYYPSYGWTDTSRRQIRRTERQLRCEGEGGRFYHGECY